MQQRWRGQDRPCERAEHLSTLEEELEQQGNSSGQQQDQEDEGDLCRHGPGLNVARWDLTPAHADADLHRPLIALLAGD
eukprot:765896-Hanusia_phi.AAC.2